MALRKKVKDQAKTALLEIPSNSDLPLRVEKISEQTGLSPLNLFLKWVLQEEFLIGLMQRNKEQLAEQPEPSPNVATRKNRATQRKRAEAVPSDPGSLDYRETLVKKAKQLKKEGMTLKKIAETFNDEKISTVSWTGKWYASSVNNLLNAKK